MYLEKLEIHGFKSFANKNILVFPGLLNKNKRGVTAIVGPNGSGKSNIADAVRWALGEQSLKTLRGKKSEDIIFSGSDKKNSLGMAEVSLYLNNEDGQALLDCSQIILTRRLYRNGDSEYLLNNNRVRLLDVQMLLAKAKFGQKTYSVIGQGVVENFLNISLTERKEFFDEATGVKQFQIKRDDSLNKLRSSYENLNQARLLLSEIEPRLKSLTRQANKLQKRAKIEAELKKHQFNYYRKIWHEIHNKFSQANERFLEIEKIKLAKEKRLASLNRELNQIEADNKYLEQLNGWQQELTKEQNQKDTVIQQLARIEAQFEAKLEAGGQFNLSWLNNKKQELAKEIEAIREEINLLTKNVGLEQDKRQALIKEKEEVNGQIQQFNQKLVSDSSKFNNQSKQNIYKQLKEALVKLERAEAESEIKKIKIILREIKEEFKQIIIISAEPAEQESLKQAQHDLIKLTKIQEAAITSINEANFRVSAGLERIKLLAEKKSAVASELSAIKIKLKQYQSATSADEINKKQKEFQEKIININQEINKIKEKISDLGRQAEAKRSRLFSLQKDLQNLQNEINNLNIKLNELKVNLTRYETKLEDLEIEIRRNFGDLKKIKEQPAIEQIDQDAVQDKINQLKYQLNLIGGIDPEIIKEFQESKQRFDFLSGQVNDLTKAIDSLEKIIKELDLIIKEKFDKKFKTISTKFEDYFKILFNGGKAKIIKVIEPAEENKEYPVGSLEACHGSAQASGQAHRIKFLQKHNATGLAGIEIQATPPGKKIKSISMLSGGERALTAIALICACLSANPSPFVVLDEVDAALDEANSERFAKILSDLTYKTQFIIITHNRASMRKANVLYGITMGSDGVSKLLSVKLEEADI